jgi:uncharacterized protein (TIGR03083 family)
VLNRDTYLEVLDRDANAFVRLVHEADLATPVPDCPGWDVGDLARHLGGIHRWAYAAVATGSPGEPPQGPTDRDELVTWFDAGAAQLLDVLRATDPDSPAWTFGPPPRTASFWVRRQAHETSVHVRDARRALDVDVPVDSAVADDGVDEVVTLFVPRQVRLERIAPLPHTVALELTDTGTAYVLSSGDQASAAEAAATVTGTAQDVLLALWRRLPVDALTIEGDLAAARAVFALALTP